VSLRYLRCFQTPRVLTGAEIASKFPRFSLLFSNGAAWEVPPLNYLFQLVCYCLLYPPIPWGACEGHLVLQGMPFCRASLPRSQGLSSTRESMLAGRS